jgi:hypothetical protein
LPIHYCLCNTIRKSSRNCSSICLLFFFFKLIITVLFEKTCRPLVYFTLFINVKTRPSLFCFLVAVYFPLHLGYSRGGGLLCGGPNRYIFCKPHCFPQLNLLNRLQKSSRQLRGIENSAAVHAHMHCARASTFLFYAMLCKLCALCTPLRSVDVHCRPA